MQTARGASLTDANSRGRPSRRPVAVLLGLAALVWVIDQVTKTLALERLDGGERVRVVGELLSLRLVRNPGAAFGVAGDLTVVFTCLAVVVVAVLLRLAPRLRSLRWAAALGLLLGGAGGNLIDRVTRDPAPLRGHVVDFLELPNFPVFNVADIAITTAAGLMLLLSVRGVPVVDEPAEPDAPDAPDAR